MYFSDEYGVYDVSAHELGEVGEKLTYDMLYSMGCFKILRNLYVPFRDTWVQIDLIGVAKNGIFLIENKNYHGDISGKRGDRYFKVTYPNGYVANLNNPYLQNCLHMQALFNILPRMFHGEIINVVIFNAFATLNISGYNNVMLTREFRGYYENLHRDVLLDTVCIRELLEPYEDRYGVCNKLHEYMLGIKDRDNLIRERVWHQIYDLDLERTELSERLVKILLNKYTTK